MPSLLDIGGLVETVVVRGKELEVPGISAYGLLHLLAKFPELRKLLAGGEENQLTPDQVLVGLPNAVAAIIAAGTGSPGIDEAEKVAASLSISDQTTLVGKIWEVSFPKGLKDFTEALEKLAANVTGESGWAQGTKLPEPLRTVSPADMPPQ